MAEILAQQGIQVAVINPRWIKPLDTEMITRFAKKSSLLVTLEDHILLNGFGTGIAEHLSDQRLTTPLLRIGWPDQFIEHGSVPILRKKYGLTAEAITEKIIRALSACEKS